MAFSCEDHAQGANSGTKVNKEEVHSNITQGPSHSNIIQRPDWSTIFPSNPKEDRESVFIKLVGDVRLREKDWSKVQKDIEKEELGSAIDTMKVKFSKSKYKPVLVFKRFKLHKLTQNGRASIS